MTTSPAKKQSPLPEPRATEVRPLSAARTRAPSYALPLAHEAARKLVAACVVVMPLGAMAGLVSACGGAQPTQPAPYYKGEPRVAEPPPSASASGSALPGVAPIAPPESPSATPR
jgi:hypothetical protein